MCTLSGPPSIISDTGSGSEDHDAHLNPINSEYVLKGKAGQGSALGVKSS